VLPHLSAAQIATVDAQLAAVPALGHLDDRELLTVLDRCASALTGLHGYEVLAALLRDHSTTVSLAAVALAAAQLARLEGVADDDLAAAYPGTLALTPPKIARTVERSNLAAADPAVALDEGALNPREALRLRVRWVHELSARAALELGARLAERGVLDDTEDVRHVAHTDLRRAVESDRRRPLRIDPTVDGPVLPAEFRLAPDRSIVDIGATRGEYGARGLPASAGRAEGIAWDGHGERPTPAVLVVRTLDPRLASVLPDCVAIVAETGNVLSHLAILAREYRVPAVVAFTGAVDAFVSGTHLSVDGGTGRVTIAAAAPDFTPSGAHA
jgi:pyruvate,water dikinase